MRIAQTSSWRVVVRVLSGAPEGPHKSGGIIRNVVFFVALIATCIAAAWWFGFGPP
ncbi:MAG TPA: hypothetical protein VN610_07590 [Bryobacteraceae bacterium]|nr:hypothetical protein [Bryobacteraceae bacterium]